MPRHWLLPRRQPFIFLNQHHSLPSRIHIRERTKEDNELPRWRNQPLAGINYRASKMIPARIRVSHVCTGVCMRAQKYTCDDRPPKKKLPTSTVRLCMTSARQVQLTRLFRTEQGALSRGSLGTLMAESLLASMSHRHVTIASPDVSAVIDIGI